MTTLTTWRQSLPKRRVHSRSGLRLAAAVVAAAIGFAPFSLFTASATAQPRGPVLPLNVPSVLVFPFAADAANAPASVAPSLDAALVERLNNVGAYKVTRYTKFLAQVQRAIEDRILSDEDAAGPFDSAAKANTVAQQVDTDDYLIGTIDTLTIDPTNKHVTVEVSAELHNVATGSTIQALACTGTAVPQTSDESADDVTSDAVADAAGKLASALNVNHPTGGGLVAVRRPHRNTVEYVLAAILTGVLAYAIGHNSTHNSGSGNSSVNTSIGGSTTVSGVPGIPSPPAAP